MNKVMKQLFSKKSFVISLAILLFFVIISIFANYLTPYTNPYSFNQEYVANPYSPPEWASIFPQYSGLPPTYNNLLSSSQPQFIKNGTVSYAQVGSSKLSVYMKGSDSFFNVSYPFSYDSSKYKEAPSYFTIAFSYLPKGVNSTEVQLNVYLIHGNKTFFISSYVPSAYTLLFFYPVCTINMNSLNNIYISSRSLTYSNSPFVNSLSGSARYEGAFVVPSLIFKGEPSSYKLMVSIVDLSGQPINVTMTKPSLHTEGYLFGIMGTDFRGSSVFAEFVLGARFDLELSVITAVVIVAIGLIVGLVAGYKGGKADLILNSITDFFLTIPTLPLFIVLESMLVATGLILSINIVVLLFLLIALLSWMATMKVIRSATLTLRGRTFVEASRALGGGSFHIIMKHLIPNILGIIVAQIAYDVPTVILIESGIDFLGLGITSFPTWGNMLGYASHEVTASNGFVWWWILPPGLGIILLSVAFYFIGTSLRDVLSPYKTRGEI
ncbi:ABC transporter permease [Sulfuracidifex metallicus]|uniref:ABC transporter permease n=1 Tax=Sulfuracidifex metallicus TaxID=47303 RepID=UPI002274BD98|nr:ABC transporter permease [Sulfuracidifex metallicus]MCY0850343.1 ABC transporter permease [Sulfuracidifex metallicus]